MLVAFGGVIVNLEHTYPFYFLQASRQAGGDFKTYG